jgi:hypothetical protein
VILSFFGANFLIKGGGLVEGLRLGTLAAVANSLLGILKLD